MRTLIAVTKTPSSTGLKSACEYAMLLKTCRSLLAMMFVGMSALVAPAHAFDIRSAQGFEGMNAHAQNRVLEDGASVQWWPVQHERGGWSLTVVRRDASMIPVWEASLPLPADAVQVPDFTEKMESWQRSRGMRETVAAEVLLRDNGGLLVAYVEGFSLMGADVSADGSVSEPRPLAKVAEGAYGLAVSADGGRLAVVAKGKLQVLDRSGNAVFSSDAGSGLRAVQPVFLPDGHVVVAGNRGQEETASLEWFTPTGTLIQTTEYDLLQLNGTPLIPMESGEQQYLLQRERSAASPNAMGEAMTVDSFTALPVSPTETAGRVLSLGTEEALRSGNSNEKYKVDGPYSPGATAMLGVVPDGEGGLVYAVRGSRILTVIYYENGVEQSRSNETYSGEMVAERMRADGSVVWSTVIPEKKRSMLQSSDVNAGHMGIHGGKITLLQESSECGSTMARSWCHISIDVDDGGILETKSYARFLPQSGIYAPETSWTAPDGSFVYSFRSLPKTRLMQKQYDTDSGFMVQVDPSAPNLGLSLASPFAAFGSGPDFEAGRQMGRTADASHPFRRPFVRGFLTAVPVALLTQVGASTLISPTGKSQPAVSGTLCAGIALGGLSARYLEQKPTHWWGSQSSDFQAGFRAGYPRKSIRRATFGGLFSGLMFAAIPVAAKIQDD